MERIRSSPYGRRLASGSFWVFSGTAISKVMTWLAIICVARILGRKTFGEMGIIQNTMNMFLVFAAFNMSYTTTKYVAENRQRDPVRAGRIMSLSLMFCAITGLIFTLIVVALSPQLSQRMLNAPQLAGPLALGAVVIFLGALNATQAGSLAGFEDFRSSAMVNMVSGFLGFPLLVGGAYYGGLRGVVLGMLLQVLCLFVGNHWAVNRCIRRAGIEESYASCFQEIPVILSFSLPGMLNGLVCAPVTWVCAVWLVNTPSGYDEMGIYNAANQLQILVLYLSGILGTVALPVLASLNGIEKGRQFRKILRWQVWLNGTVTACSASLMAALSGFVMSWYGSGFQQGRWVLVLLCISSVFTSVGGVYGIVMASLDRLWIALALRAIWAIAMLLVAGPAVKYYGALGLAQATLLANIVHMGIQALCIHWLMNRHFGVVSVYNADKSHMGSPV